MKNKDAEWKIITNTCLASPCVTIYYIRKYAFLWRKWKRVKGLCRHSTKICAWPRESLYIITHRRRASLNPTESPLNTPPPEWLRWPKVGATGKPPSPPCCWRGTWAVLLRNTLQQYLIKSDVHHDPETPFPNTDPRGMKIHVLTRTCSPKFYSSQPNTGDHGKGHPQEAGPTACLFMQRAPPAVQGMSCVHTP